MRTHTHKDRTAEGKAKESGTHVNEINMTSQKEIKKKVKLG